MKVFLPIVVKAIIDLWKEIIDAYDENNLNELHAMADVVEKNKRVEKC